MTSLRNIRRRIKSVKNAHQITRAMELVAASKMKKAQQSALAGRPYANLMADMLAALSGRVENIFENPLTAKRDIKTRGILLITSNKGLCGSFNANIFKLISEIKTPVKYVAIGRKGSQFLARTGRNLLAEFSISDRPSFAEMKATAKFMANMYIEGTIDSIEVTYQRFKNTLVQEPTIRPLLPVTNVREFITQHQTNGNRKKFTDDRVMLFEPNIQAVLEALLSFYINRWFYQVVLSAKASEHSARMVAMRAAKDSAIKLIGDLTLEYNKARQASITQETLEVAAASFAST